MICSIPDTAAEPGTPHPQQPVGEISDPGGGCAERNRKRKRPRMGRNRAKGQEPILVHAGCAGDFHRHNQHGPGGRPAAAFPTRGREPKRRTARCLYSYAKVLSLRTSPHTTMPTGERRIGPVPYEKRMKSGSGGREVVNAWGGPGTPARWSRLRPAGTRGG